VTVEHVHVHEGGQAIVGNVETKGGGVANEIRDQPHALAYAPGATMPSTDTPRVPVRLPRDAERPLPHARRDLNGRAEGKIKMLSSTAAIRLKQFVGDAKSRNWSGWHGAYASRRKWSLLDVA
jgi:hypothetical protein